MTLIAKARELAAATPDERNRYVDFLRAVAILSVVLGHWLMAAVWIDGAGFHAKNLLEQIPATQWLTWGLQVMPIFFLVGGYANAAGSAGGGAGYGAWLQTRIRRLALPAVPLVLLWTAIGLGGPQLGLDPALARLGSQVALIPLWFLAVYVLMVAATPVTRRLWSQYRGRAVLGLGSAALAVDALRAVTTIHVGFANYAFVWGAIYLLGHAWHDGAFARPSRGGVLAVGSLAVLITMTVIGPYHISMVGVPGVEFGNTAPPSAALLALGLSQIGLAMAVQKPMSRLLRRRDWWTGTVLVNGSIMTIYLWHMTAMVLTIGALQLAGGALLHAAPGSPQWWITRPLWLALLAAATVPLLAFGRFEHSARRSSRPGRNVTVYLATVGVCISFASVAAKGLTSAHPIWAIAGVLPLVLAAVMLRTRRHVGELSRS